MRSISLLNKSNTKIGDRDKNKGTHHSITSYNSNRYLRDFSRNHTKQHYTYQYMSYTDSKSNFNSMNNDSNNNIDHIITTSVSIRVTPIENYYVSWSILWCCFVVTAIVAFIQVLREQHIFYLRRQTTTISTNATTTTSENNGATTTASSNNVNRNTIGINNNNNNGSTATRTISNSKMGSQQQQQQQQRLTAIDDESQSTIIQNNHLPMRNGDAASSVGDNESVSTADLTRSLFRKLLLFAMITRIILTPVQIWSDPMWWQFVSDTLPEIVFATAWTVLVTFFVQLVGIASGTGTNTSPGLAISATVYFVYFILIVLQLFNKIASVLLYALMCCIYTTLFGVVIYFCPKLINLMRPSLQSHRGLAIRLILATSVCITIFGIHCINYARLVIAPPRKVYWWYQYGILELLPSIIFLSIMHPQTNKSDRSYSPTPEIASRLTASNSSMSILRVDSGIRNTTATPELESLLPSQVGNIGGNQHNNGGQQVRTPIIVQNKGPTSMGYGTNLSQQQQQQPSIQQHVRPAANDGLA